MNETRNSPSAVNTYAKSEIELLREVFDAAYGLCMGYDWNNGTAAKFHGYKRKLLKAVHAVRDVPDFDGKYRTAK